MANVLSADEITALFTAARERIAPFKGRPSDENVQELVETLSSVLLQIPFDISTNHRDSLLALITTDDEYFGAFGHAFTIPPQVGNYDTTIPANATSRERAERESIHIARVKDRASFDTTLRLVRQFILDHVEEVWYRTHWIAIFAYSRVPPRALLATIRNIATGRQATDNISLLNKMQTFFHTAEGLPQYINMLEDLQKQALRIDPNDPITDTTILKMAIADVLKSGQYPKLEDAWSLIVNPALRTWDAWKLLAIAEYDREEIRRAAKGGANTFGGAANATNTANTATFEEQPPPAGGDGLLHPAALAEMEAALDNFANAARTDNDTVAELTSSIRVLTRNNENLSDALITSNNMLRNLHADYKRMAIQANLPVPPDPSLPPIPRENPGGGGRGGGRGGRGGGRGGRGGRGDERRGRGPGGPGACSICGWNNHIDDTCFEVPANAARRPRNWRSALT